MKLLSWNILQGGGRRADGIAKVLLEHAPDIITLQEYRDQTDKRGGAYVIQLTDFSENRKDPLQYDMRVSSSKEQILGFFEDWETKYFKKGWEVL